MKSILRETGIWFVALLLAVMFGILVTRVSADGPVLWKQGCPAHYEVRQEPDKAGGVTVLCVRWAEATE